MVCRAFGLPGGVCVYIYVCVNFPLLIHSLLAIADAFLVCITFNIYSLE